jgi:hypothetical protein
MFIMKVKKDATRTIVKLNDVQTLDARFLRQKGVIAKARTDDGKIGFRPSFFRGDSAAKR